MKHTFLLCAFVSLWMLNFAQTSATDKLDLPGDNLNLYAVLKIFQESETLEGFEKKLNDEANKINAKATYAKKIIAIACFFLSI